MIRVELPAQLRTLAQVDGEGKIDVEGEATQRSVLDALEACYPMLRGTIRDHISQQRRPCLRLFACETDLSHESPDTPLPDWVGSGAEPLLIIGALAGGQEGDVATSCIIGKRCYALVDLGVPHDSFSRAYAQGQHSRH